MQLVHAPEYMTIALFVLWWFLTVMVILAFFHGALGEED